MDTFDKRLYDADDRTDQADDPKPNIFEQVWSVYGKHDTKCK